MLIKYANNKFVPLQIVFFWNKYLLHLAPGWHSQAVHSHLRKDFQPHHFCAGRSSSKNLYTGRSSLNITTMNATLWPWTQHCTFSCIILMRFGINLDLQTDFLTADLGYLTNAGFTFRRGLNLIEDDRLGVELAVRISDHLENVDGATQVVLMRQSLIVNPSTTFAGGLPCRSHWWRGSECDRKRGDGKPDLEDV